MLLMLKLITPINATGFGQESVSGSQVESEKQLGVDHPTLFKRHCGYVFQDSRILGHSQHNVLQAWHKSGIGTRYVLYDCGPIHLNVHVVKATLWHVEA
jgi:ABC-type ATPase involved in cell division